MICDLNDPSNQIFLRGHDDDIVTIALSKPGNLIASGQVGINSDVCVWDFKSRKLLYRLAEHDHGVSSVAFTDDEVSMRKKSQRDHLPPLPPSLFSPSQNTKNKSKKLLVTIGDQIDKRLIIWDMSTLVYTFIFFI